MCSEFVPASELYHVESRTPIAHPAHQATDADVRRALEAEGDREVCTDGGTDSSGTERCERCEDGPATSKFSLGANYDGSMISTFKICDDCTRSLGEWFDDAGGERDV